jgi:putative cell wall-binding protein
MHRLARAALGALTALATALPSTTPVAAQIPDLDELPVAPPGAVGELLEPVTDLVEDLVGAVGDLVDPPQGNAVVLTAADAVEAAIALSRATFESAGTAFLGRDDLFADTLSSVAGQGIAGAPLLLTSSGALDGRTAEELDRLGVDRVVVLGNQAAVSDDVVAALEASGRRVDRIGGASRIETAAALAAALSPRADEAVLLRAYGAADGDPAQAYADALSAGPLASSRELPSLLTTSESLHPATAAYLQAADVRSVTIVGGEAAVGPAVEADLADMGIAVTRIAGDNRFATAIGVAEAMGITTAADANRLILTEAVRSSDPLWAAGFAAAAHGAVYDSPVILADGAVLPPETVAFIVAGLAADPLRVANEPLICNSFVDPLACRLTSLLMLGDVVGADDLVRGLIRDILGDELFTSLVEALDGVVPGSGEAAQGLVDALLGLLGEDDDEDAEDGDGGDGDDPTAEQQLTALVAGQPAEVADALTRLVGAPGDRESTTRQQAVAAVLADVTAALGGPVDTSDPAQAAALVALLDGIDDVLGAQLGSAPVADLADVLEAVEALAADLVDAAAVVDVVDGLGTDVSEPVDGLVDDVVDALEAAPSFLSEDDELVDRYGEQARPLAEAVERIRG